MFRAVTARLVGLALVLPVAACDASLTSPAASLVGATGALHDAVPCDGLNNARTMGARPRAERECDFTPVPLGTSVTTLDLDVGAPLALVVTNPNPAPARFYEITLPDGIVLERNTCHGYIPSIAAGARCELTFARTSTGPVTGFVIGKWFTTLADGTAHFGILKVAVTGD